MKSGHIGRNSSDTMPRPASATHHDRFQTPNRANGKSDGLSSTMTDGQA